MGLGGTANDAVRLAAGESSVPPTLAANLLVEMHEVRRRASGPPDNPLNDLTEHEYYYA